MILSYCIVHILVALRVRVIWRRKPWIGHFILLLLVIYVVAATTVTNIVASQIARECTYPNLRCRVFGAGSSLDFGLPPPRSRNSYVHLESLRRCMLWTGEYLNR